MQSAKQHATIIEVARHNFVANAGDGADVGNACDASEYPASGEDETSGEVKAGHGRAVHKRSRDGVAAS